MNFQYSIQNNQCSIKNGFRQMDVQLGRWHVVDAMAEKYMSTSPYSYANNDPVNHIDVMGLAVGGPDRRTMILHNRLQGRKKFGDDRDYICHNNGLGRIMSMSLVRLGREVGPTGADYDAFIAMGGGSEGLSFTDWYAHGGRAGMDLYSYLATDSQGSYVGIDAQDIGRNIKSGFQITVVDFNGDICLVSHIGSLVAGDFAISDDGIEYMGEGMAAVVYLQEEYEIKLDGCIRGCHPGTGISFPDNWSVDISGDLFVGGGGGGTISLGSIKGDGVFANATGRTGPGVSVGFSITFTTYNFTKSQFADARNLQGPSVYGNVGAALFNGGLSSDLHKDRLTGNINFGNYYKTNSFGFSFCSKTILGGTAGIAYTSPPWYLYNY